MVIWVTGSEVFGHHCDCNCEKCGLLIYGKSFILMQGHVMQTLEQSEMSPWMSECEFDAENEVLCLDFVVKALQYGMEGLLRQHHNTINAIKRCA